MSRDRWYIYKTRRYKFISRECDVLAFAESCFVDCIIAVERDYREDLKKKKTISIVMLNSININISAILFDRVYLKEIKKKKKINPTCICFSTVRLAITSTLCGDDYVTLRRRCMPKPREISSFISILKQHQISASQDFTFQRIEK